MELLIHEDYFWTVDLFLTDCEFLKNFQAFDDMNLKQRLSWTKLWTSVSKG